jgi:UDP:flavonoid glycosyltransferase YjiC (YdhE family)
MKICLATIGSDGDVQPYLALARGLLAHGHDVHLAAVKRYAARADALGVPFIPVCAGWDDDVMQARFTAPPRSAPAYRRSLSGTWAISPPGES